MPCFFHAGLRGLAVLSLMMGALSAAPPAAAEVGTRTSVLAAGTPLLIPGKKTLYQRVLTRPGATLVADPERAKAGGKPLQPFSVLFVYNRQMVGDHEWLAVGPASQGGPEGWVRLDQAIEWRQTLTVAFTNPANRERALLFRDDKALNRVLAAEAPQEQVAALRKTMSGGALPDGFPVVSMEPATHVDFTKNFYLLPILEAQEVMPAHGFSTRVLKIASVTAREQPAASPAAGAPDAGAVTASAREMGGFKAAVVFAIDTTRSMDPYIERTQQAIRKISTVLTGTPELKDRVSFGLVGFRNSLKEVPSLEYLTKVFVDLKTGRDVDAFLKQATALQATKASSHSFDEDAFAGVLAAANELNWDEYAARYLVLITDAGSLRSTDPASSTGMDAEQVRRLVLDKNIAPFVLHLQTPAGRGNHAKAAEQYKALSEFPNLGALYYPIKGGSVDEFGATVDTLVDTISKHLVSGARGALAAAPAVEAAPKPTAAAKPAEAVAVQASLVGRAMQLAYLGRVRDTEVPPVFEAWIADRDAANPDLMALEVRVLLAKTQLNDLQQTLKLVVEAAKTSQLAPNDFYNQLRSAAATMSRDPAAIGRRQSRTLADSGLLGEYLDDLPYRSKAMNIDQELWESWSIGEQQAFIDEVEAKIRLYQRYHDDVDRWIAFDGGKVPGDAVYPVPLDALP